MISEEMKQKVIARDGLKCIYCGRTIDLDTLHIEHLMPRSKGGTEDLDNLTAACPICNTSKANRSYLDYISSPVSTNIAYSWVKAYIKSPKITSIFSIIGSILTVVAFAWTMMTSAPKDSYSSEAFVAQIEQLNTTQEGLENLLIFIKAQREDLELSQRKIEDLRTEKERLEPLVNSDREIVESIFQEQELRNIKAQKRERWIGFGLGFVASIISSVFLLVIRFFLLPKNDA
jgi:hypothetical protein